MGSLSNGIGFRAYLITDGAGPEAVARLEAALPGFQPGEVAVQLRAKALSGRALYEAAAGLCERLGARAPLYVNDRADVALAVGAEGVHLPSTGLPVKLLRRAVKERLRIGASTHSLSEAQSAQDGGADFVTFGPVWATASKAAWGPPVGVDRLGEVVRALSVPVFALGGVSAERAPECLKLDARVACIGAWQDAASAGALARAFAVGR